MTHTYAVLEVSPECYAEVRGLLEAAGYTHTFHAEQGDGSEVIDMQGIALRAGPPAPAAPVAEHEERLTKLMDEAFGAAMHPAMLDWVAVVFELRRLRRVQATQGALLRKCLAVFEDDKDVPGLGLLREVQAAVRLIE